jgi:citrate lyase subunit beta/citryl-CoA lyase
MTNATSLADARSFLFVPGNRPERFEKAIRSGADAVVLDLEDSVPSFAKQAARVAIADAWDALKLSKIPLVVRINSLDRTLGEDDVAWLSTLTPPAGVMVPKADSADALTALNARLPGAHLLPLIESASGYAALSQVGGATGVLRLVIGHIDFVADTGLSCSTDERELTPLRFAVAMCTRLFGLAPAVDGVTVSINDDEVLEADTRRALSFGFGAKLCIHPRQIQIVHKALAPSPKDVEWARRVVAADAESGGAAVQLDGRMVDVPVVMQAQRTLARAALANAQ